MAFELTTGSMTAEQRQAWWREQREKPSAHKAEAAYVNARFRCSHYAAYPTRYRTRDHEQASVQEWYRQGTAPGNAWRL